VVYDYNGKIHRANFVMVSWGKTSKFKGILDSYNTTYNDFKPDGTPLRAKLSLIFSSYTDPVTAEQDAHSQSHDMTPLIDAVAGDSLSQLSIEHYSSPDYYVQLARFNRLDKFRHLTPGSHLIGPPLVNGVGE